jgi:putative ABC transport system substrate-binding protein
MLLQPNPGQQMQFDRLQRREFITLLGGAAAYPLAARAQERSARVGALMVVAESSPESMRLAGALEAGLAAAGWRQGRNLELVYRWGATNVDLLARHADELLRARPNVLLAFGTPSLIPLHKATTTIPIVFAAVSDPVGQGFVASISRPGGNLTGFSNFDPDIGGKWLQVLRDVAPAVTTVTVMFNPRTSPYNMLWMRAIESAAPKFGISASQASVQSDEHIRDTLASLGGRPGQGLIVPSDGFTYDRAGAIAAVALENRIPAVYAFPRFAHEGGLIAYGVDLADQIRNAAGYIARILKGENSAELPIQTPTRYTLAINLKTAKALSLTVPDNLLALADEVIE